MRKFLLVGGLATVLVICKTQSFAQVRSLTSAAFVRGQVDFFQQAVSAIMPVMVDSVQAKDEIITEAAPESWMQWTVVENYTFGKDRGMLTMIADLNALHPFFRDKVKALIIQCRKRGIELAVVETYRTRAKQNEYRMMGRKYTNSPGGKSKHQYGLAVDVVPMVNGRAAWDNAALWRKVGAVGEKLGLRWGGRWRKPYDPGHFEWTGGLNSTHLSAGILPAIPAERYPCIHEDIDFLKQCWNEWEMRQQEVLTRKNSTPVEKSN